MIRKFFDSFVMNIDSRWRPVPTEHSLAAHEAEAIGADGKIRREEV